MHLRVLRSAAEAAAAAAAKRRALPVNPTTKTTTRSIAAMYASPSSSSSSKSIRFSGGEFVRSRKANSKRLPRYAPALTAARFSASGTIIEEEEEKEEQMKDLLKDQKGIVSDAGVYTTKEEKMFLKNAIQLKGGKNAFILGIETSCDDTACAIVTRCRGI